jgi:uncharacterized protein VirK/YbjX
MTMPETQQPQQVVFPEYDIWAATRGMSHRRKLLFPFLFIRHLRTLMPLLLAPRDSNLRKLLNSYPEILGIMLTKYVSANWDTSTRVARLVDHHRAVAEIGGAIDFAPGDIVELIKIAPIDLRYRITLDQPRWLLREGSLILSLWDGPDRIFHLGFCLSTEKERRVAYIGSLQGRNETDIHNYTIDILNRYRLFSRAAYGMRPRDFLVEVFKMFCKALGISEIHAVADFNHPQRQITPDVKLSYDKIWIERGGRRGDNGFFILPVAAGRRNINDASAKKRAMYVKRYSMLDAVEAKLTAALSSGQKGPAAGHQGVKAG